MKHLLLLLTLALLPLYGQTQSFRDTKHQWNSWIMYFGNHPLNAHWGIHLELQARRADLLDIPQQWLLRNGLHYYVNPNSTLTAGYCRVETYPYGAYPTPAPFPENRIWEQWQLTEIRGRAEIIHRFRLEQRWVNSPVPVDGGFAPGTAVYSNRFRSLHRFSFPLKIPHGKPAKWRVSCYNEMMVSFGKNVQLNVFDQNRAYAALGRQFTKWGRIELGYMNQILIKADGKKTEMNHTLQLAWSFSKPISQPR
jgi:hypothetical protein